MNDFHEWMKNKYPEQLDEFYGASLMNRPQSGMMNRTMNMANNAATNLQGGQVENKKLGWLLNTIKNMLGSSPDGMNTLIRMLMALRKDLMKSGAPTPAPVAPDMSVNPIARPTQV